MRSVACSIEPIQRSASRNGTTPAESNTSMRKLRDSPICVKLASKDNQALNFADRLDEAVLPLLTETLGGDVSTPVLCLHVCYGDSALLD